MAILEELTTKLGFEVTGIQKLRAASKEWDRAKKSATASSKAMVITGKSTAVATTRVSRLGTALRSTVAIFARLIAVAAGTAAAVAAVGTAFVVAGVRAARARREFALTAKGLGTKAQNLETTTNFLRYLGLGDDAKGDTQKAVGAINDILKTIRAGGEEADEARKKFAGLKLDEVFKIDPKTGQMRDAAAVLLDIIAAYKQLQEQAGAYRKQADDIAKKQPRKASQLRQKALELDRKGTKLADESGIEGKLKVLLDEKNWEQITEAFAKGASQRPTTSNASEAAQKSVAEQAEEASLKAGALLKGTTDRLEELGIVLATKVLPPVNDFLDKLLAFGKWSGLIPENVGEKASRESKERLDAMAAGRRAERETYDTTPQGARNKTQADAFRREFEDDRKRHGTPTTAPLPPSRPLPAREKDTSPAPEGWLQYFRRMLSPETNASKLQKTAEQSADNRKYENIGNDQKTINVTNNLQVADPSGVAAAATKGVLGAISTKGANTSTGALTAP